MDGQSEILKVQNLSAAYNGNKVLCGISFNLSAGDFLVVAGPNGAGKSTLLRLLAALIKPLDGEITLFGKPLSSFSRRALSKKVALVFQGFSFPYDFTVSEIVSLGRTPFISRWMPLSREDLSLIREAMELTDTWKLRDRSFFALSAGERQRVILAKAFAQQPSILLLDEPATHLDIHHQVSVFNILSRINQQKRTTIICITHDLTLAAQYTDHFLFLSAGHIIAEGCAPNIIRKPLIEELFKTAVYVGTLPQTERPFIYPIRKNINYS
ncbi:MAG: ABC transporter ATP-binding protein [Candidatus Sumerlaeia bacterium]|nr:ABC transporter ATP-binding protein [Candidatus Sumerlaeia bacterium]